MIVICTKFALDSIYTNRHSIFLPEGHVVLSIRPTCHSFSDGGSGEWIINIQSLRPLRLEQSGR